MIKRKFEALKQTVNQLQLYARVVKMNILNAMKIVTLHWLPGENYSEKESICDQN